MSNKLNPKDVSRILNTAFLSIIKNTKDMIFVKDANLVYVAASMPFVRMVGKDTPEEIVGRTDMDIFENEDLAKRYVADDKRLIANDKDLIDYMEPLPDDNGWARYGSTSKYILKEDNCVIGVIGITKDITKDYLAHQHYQQEIRYLFNLPEDTYSVCYIDVDDWRLISLRRQNIGAGSLQTCVTVDEVSEQAVESIVDAHSEVADFYRNFSKGSLYQAYSGGRTSLSFQYQRRLTDGSIHWVDNSIRFLIDVDSGHLCAMLTARDIDREKSEEEKLVVAAKMDKMTMVLNRETTMESIQQILTADKDLKHALFMLDVDNFKMLNDTLGHQAGDEFLIALASKIRGSFDREDVVGRIGGDEFFILLRDVKNGTEITKKAKELIETVQKTGDCYENIPLSGSVGISLYPENGKTIGELYAQADAALYQAKRTGKNQYIFASAN